MISAGNISIREIESADNAAIAQIIRDCLIEFGANGPGYAWQDPEIDSMFEVYQNPKRVFYILEREASPRHSEIVGGGGIAELAGEAKGQDVCELQKMYFAKSIRGQGWGEKLLQKLLDRARHMGYRKCYLETLQRMDAANGLYRKLGFRPLESPLGNTGHCSCDYWYVKDL